MTASTIDGGENSESRLHNEADLYHSLSFGEMVFLAVLNWMAYSFS